LKYKAPAQLRRSHFTVAPGQAGQTYHSEEMRSMRQVRMRSPTAVTTD